jgi:hypothetical protein
VPVEIGLEGRQLQDLPEQDRQSLAELINQCAARRGMPSWADTIRRQLSVGVQAISGGVVHADRTLGG